MFLIRKSSLLLLWLLIHLMDHAQTGMKDLYRLFDTRDDTAGVYRMKFFQQGMERIARREPIVQ